MSAQTRVDPSPLPPTGRAAGALSSLDLSPAGGSAPTARRLASATAFDTRLLLRNAEQLLVSLGFPVIALLALVNAPLAALGLPARLDALAPVDVVAPGVLAMAVLGTSFTGQAIQLGFDRRYGVLRLLATTPLGRSGFLAGRLGSVLVVEALQVLVLGGAAVALGWRPWSAGPLAVPALLLALALGSAAMVSIALLLASTLRAEAVLALANVVYVLLLGAGVLLPVSVLPAGLAVLASFTPSGAMGEAARAAGIDGAVAVLPLVVMALWAAAAAAAAARWGRWSS